jgi:flagellar motor switch protein FliM
VSDDFLSQDEVDALLKGVDGEAKDATGAADAGGVRTYDLGRQGRNISNRIPALELINERFTRYLRSGLFNYMQRSCEVAAGSIKVQQYSEFIRSLAVPANLNLIQAKPLRGNGLVILDPNLVFLVIDNMFGGDGRFHTRIEGRDFTPTEQRIVSGLLDIVFKEYQKAWKPVYSLMFEYVRSEINPQFANIATPSEIVITITFTIELSGTSAEMHICLPYSMLEPIRDILYSTPQNEQAPADKRWNSILTRQLQSADVELSAALGHATVTLGDIVKMKAGDIVPIEIDEQLIALVEEIPVLQCRFGVQNGQYALKVERFATSDESVATSRN